MTPQLFCGYALLCITTSSTAKENIHPPTLLKLEINYYAQSLGKGLFEGNSKVQPAKKRLGNQMKNNSALITNIQGMPGIRRPFFFYKLSLLLDHSAAAALPLVLTAQYTGKLSEVESLLFEGSSPNPELFGCKPFACHISDSSESGKNPFYYLPVSIKL